MSVAAPLWFWKFGENNSKILIFFAYIENYGASWKIMNRIYKEGGKFWRWEGYLWQKWLLLIVKSRQLGLVCKSSALLFCLTLLFYIILFYIILLYYFTLRKAGNWDLSVNRLLYCFVLHCYFTLFYFTLFYCTISHYERPAIGTCL